MTRVPPGDTVVAVWLGRFGRNFDDSVRIQADLTEQNISIVAGKGGSTPLTTTPRPSFSAGVSGG